MPTDPSQSGRGWRKITLKSRKLPGEITTECESDIDATLNDASHLDATSKSSKKKTKNNKDNGNNEPFLCITISFGITQYLNVGKGIAKKTCAKLKQFAFSTFWTSDE